MYSGREALINCAAGIHVAKSAATHQESDLSWPPISVQGLHRVCTKSEIPLAVSCNDVSALLRGLPHLPFCRTHDIYSDRGAEFGAACGTLCSVYIFAI